MKRLFTFLALATSLIASGQSFNWTPQTSGVSTTLSDVFFTDNQNGWVVGDDGVILHTSDGGQTWAPQASGTTINLKTVFFIDSLTGWAAGHDLSNVLLKTTNGGSTWTEIPSSGIGFQIRDIAFGSANNGYLVTGSNSIYATTDGGTNWTLQTVNTQTTQQSFRVVCAPTDTTAFVGGRSKRPSFFSAYADVFAKVQSPSVDFLESVASNFSTSDLEINAIEFATANIGFAGGTSGILYKLEHTGTSTAQGPWDINLDLQSGIAINDISFPTAADGMLISYGVNNVGLLVYHTSDTGNTWSMMPDTLPNNVFYASLHAPDANTAWITGSAGQIFKGTLSGIGIEESALLAQVRLYPNPTAGKVTVEVKGTESADLNYRLVDITGRELLTGTWQKTENAQRFELDMSNVVSGVYLLHIADTTGKSKVIRVAKQ